MKELHPLMQAALPAESSAESTWDVAERRIRPHLSPSHRLVGHGGEGFVYWDGEFITKFLTNWTHPKRDADQTERWLRELAAVTAGASHLYDIRVRRLDHDLLAVSYAAEPGRPLTPAMADQDWDEVRPQLIACLEELAAAGFGLTNPRAANFVWDRKVLKFVDYGSDCRPLADATVALARMHFMWAAGFYEKGDN